MTLEILRLIRDVLLRTFVIGVIIALLQAVATVAAWGFWTSLVTAWWHTDAQYLSKVAVGYFTAARFFLVFAVLVPGLALHWTLRRELHHKAQQ